ncbi:uncharacterized protein [Triticum aestivum]|uniref:uncharacterized protein n=1 Tax=Triticum aestivum TaxID=4565 RepID=UPI001D00D178|nr:uncharacterized protein LOC123099906 [Triticum aestivum]
MHRSWGHCWWGRGAIWWPCWGPAAWAGALELVVSMASFPPETTFVWVLASGGCAGGSVCVPLDGLLDPGGSMVVRLRCAAHGEGLSSLDEVIQRSDELVGQIGQLPPSAEIVHTMDEISNTVSYSSLVTFYLICVV